jgi:Rrf2 family protein
MRLTATDVYAMQALGYLGHRHGRGWVGSDAIAEATGIHKPYLSRVLAALVGSGILTSKKGAGGGYALARDPAEIDLREVVRAIDGPVAPLSCVSLNWHDACEEEERCHARTAVWTRVRDACLAALAEVSVADLAADFGRGLDYRPCLDHLLRRGA